MIIMGQWTRVENNNKVFHRVTNHTGQVEKNLLGSAGIRTRDLRFEIEISFATFGLKKKLKLSDNLHDTNQFQTIAFSLALKNAIFFLVPV